MPLLIILFLIIEMVGILNNVLFNNLSRERNKSLGFKNEILAIK